ncbi:glycosyltransferase family 2 protein [Thioalkalivibrio sp. ALE11]|uniref:glycosyltransferase family 2 protein n=1 Tax=Thioalkalivibrio sp. ALE11 TaxID=1265494 RepID=UPI0003790BFE|nr:glycosyltransferase family 2 protein [Thioalkalivibrio sp. ALE11]
MLNHKLSPAGGWSEDVDREVETTVRAPVFSVVMPAHNAEAHLRDAVESVRAQTFPDWELLVADDASSDGTGALVEALASEDSRIRVLRRNVNGGPAKARNDAIAASRGRFVAFLDSDDIWYPAKLERQKAVFEDEAPALVFSSYERWDVQTGRRQAVPCPREIAYDDLLFGNVVGCLTAVYVSVQRNTFFLPGGAGRMMVPNPVGEERHHGMAPAQSERVAGVGVGLGA